MVGYADLGLRRRGPIEDDEAPPFERDEDAGMDVAQLVAFGERLASDLAAAAKRYHVKSDQHDILEYESASVRAYVAWLVCGVLVPTQLRESVLLGEWGRGCPWEERELLLRVSEFYREIEAHGAATGSSTPS
ncbi:MAG TPA: hypothetical protein VFU02_00970 [Polyangiaceae bacterium]|nr:hypothetical protein [Polyangiaceae bacterium]